MAFKAYAYLQIPPAGGRPHREVGKRERRSRGARTSACDLSLNRESEAPFRLMVSHPLRLRARLLPFDESKPDGTIEIRLRLAVQRVVSSAQ